MRVVARQQFSSVGVVWRLKKDVCVTIPLEQPTQIITKKRGKDADLLKASVT